MYIVSKVMDHNGKLDEEEPARISTDLREKYSMYYSSSTQCEVDADGDVAPMFYWTVVWQIQSQLHRLRINYESVHKHQDKIGTQN